MSCNFTPKTFWLFDLSLWSCNPSEGKNDIQLLTQTLVSCLRLLLENPRLHPLSAVSHIFHLYLFITSSTNRQSVTNIVPPIKFSFAMLSSCTQTCTVRLYQWRYNKQTALFASYIYKVSWFTLTDYGPLLSLRVMSSCTAEEGMSLASLWKWCLWCVWVLLVGPDAGDERRASWGPFCCL